MIIDSGNSEHNRSNNKQNHKNAPSLILIITKIFSYKSDNPIDLLGHFTINISCNNKTHQSRIYIVKGTWRSLRVKPSAEVLHVLRVGTSTPKNVPHLDTTNDNMPISTKSIVSKYSSVFSGTGLLFFSILYFTLIQISYLQIYK